MSFTASFRQGARALLALVCALPLLAIGEPVLRVLAWPGYADADLVKRFEQRTGSKVQLRFIDSDEALWAQVNAHKAEDIDVFAVNTAELQRYIAAGLVAPIRTQMLSNTAHQLPRFSNIQGIPGLVHGGKVYAIPYTYSEMGLIYDRRQVSQPPTSIRQLWDPQFRGKVLLYNGGTHNFSLAALTLGYKSPFHIADKDWSAAAEKLIDLRRNALGFYLQPEESVEIFQREHAALMFANYGSQQVKLLRAAGADVGYVVPQEGALAWLDCWAITRGARNTALAEAWINFFLEPEAGQALSSRQGLANTTSESANLQPQDRLLWLEPLENEERRSMLWDRILAGYKMKKVMQP